MRYAVLLLLGSFGVFLLFIARYRYQVVNLQLGGLNTVEGAVDSIGQDGEVHVKYRVGTEAYEIVRSVPIKLPRVRAGDKVRLFYPSDRPDTAKVGHWSVLYPDSAVAGGFGLVAILFAIGAFVSFGNVASLRDMPDAANSPQGYVFEQKSGSSVPPSGSLDHPIQLHNARDEFYTSFLMAAGAFAAAYGLYRNPQILWTRYLAYPGAVAIVLFGIGMIFAAFENQTLRIRADADGLESEDSSGVNRFLWKDVAALKRETVTRSTWQSGKYFTRGYASRDVGHYFILLDHSGKELLKLDEDVAMEPSADWRILRAYIPARTGLPVKEESRESLP